MITKHHMKCPNIVFGCFWHHILLLLFMLWCMFESYRYAHHKLNHCSEDGRYNLSVSGVAVINLCCVMITLLIICVVLWEHFMTS